MWGSGEKLATGNVRLPEGLLAATVEDDEYDHQLRHYYLARGIGAAFIAPDIDAGEVRAFLAEKLAERC